MLTAACAWGLGRQGPGRPFFECPDEDFDQLAEALRDIGADHGSSPTALKVRRWASARAQVVLCP